MIEGKERRYVLPKYGVNRHWYGPTSISVIERSEDELEKPQDVKRVPFGFSRVLVEDER